MPSTYWTYMDRVSTPPICWRISVKNDSIGSLLSSFLSFARWSINKCLLKWSRLLGLVLINLSWNLQQCKKLESEQTIFIIHQHLKKLFLFVKDNDSTLNVIPCEEVIEEVANYWWTIGILMLNKATSSFTSNTLLIPKKDQFTIFIDLAHH